METTLRDLDEQAYRALGARAELEGRTIDDLISEAIRQYLWQAVPIPKLGSLRALTPEPFPEENERLSLEIDSVVYGQGDRSRF